MRFEEQNNETKITTMLDKIYKKLAGDDAKVNTNLDAYPNDVKVPLLLEKIHEVVDNSGESGGGSSSNRLIVHVKKENFDGRPAVFDPDEITPSVDDIFDAFEAGKDISVIVQLDFSFSDGNSSYTSTVEFALPLISWRMDTNLEYMAFSVKSIYHVPYQGSDATERMVDIVTLTLWKTKNRKAILYYGNEDIDY